MKHIKLAIIQCCVWLALYRAFVDHDHTSLLVVQFYVIMLALLAPFFLTDAFVAAQLKDGPVRWSQHVSRAWTLIAIACFVMNDKFGYAITLVLISLLASIGQRRVEEARQSI